MNETMSTDEKMRLIAIRIMAVVYSFERLDSKYGNDWTEWQDVRDNLAALQECAKDKL